MVNSGSESDRESNSLTRGEGGCVELRGVRREMERDKDEQRGREKCISPGKSVENKE